MLHGLTLRDTLRDAAGGDPYTLASAFHAASAEVVEPWFMWTRFEDRHRLAEIDTLIAGDRYEPADRRWELEQALADAATKDPDLLRAVMRASFVFAPLEETLAAPGVAERVLELGAGWRQVPVPAPPREELVAIANS
jgi:hypothetical protein